MTGYAGQVPDTHARRMDWQGNAACRTTDPDLFFDAQFDHQARTVCVVHCPVRADCLAHVTDRERGMSETTRDEGIVAGLDRKQRWRLDPTATGKQTEEQPPACDPRCGTAAALEQHLARGETVDDVCWSGEVRRVHGHRHSRGRGPAAVPPPLTDAP
ncbi:MAG TPA: WhiB family transcriptional regulator [Streptomyces sp.]|nr:WhiB family transcriptional regulator [Streptomyces sp.]